MATIPMPARSGGTHDRSLQSHLPQYRTRYGWAVSFAKPTLIVCAVALSLLVAIWPELQFAPEATLPQLIKQDAVGRHSAINPRLTGFDGRNRRFFVTADLVAQVDNTTAGFRFDRPRASLALKGGGWASLSAPQGLYWRTDGKLHLSGGVELGIGEGYEIRTDHAVIDFSSDSATSDKPVEGNGPFGRITAQGLRIVDGGAKFVFSGATHMVLKPRNRSAAGGR